MCEKFDVEVTATAAESPWSNGVVQWDDITTQLVTLSVNLSQTVTVSNVLLDLAQKNSDIYLDDFIDDVEGVQDYLEGPPTDLPQPSIICLACAEKWLD